MTQTPLGARIYIAAVCAASLVAIEYLLRREPVSFTGNTILLMVLGAAAASRLIEMGNRVHLGASHPFIFGALILEGPIEALLVSICSIIGASFMKARPMRAYQVIFNLAATTLSTAISWLVYSRFQLSPEASLERAVLPVVVTSVAFFCVSSWLVAGAVGLMAGESIWRAWYEKAFWTAPSFLAGGVIGLFIARLAQQAGTVSLVLTLPFCYLIYYSYRLYMDRLEEKKRRIEVVERLNQELESKVRERTDELLHLNERLQISNAELAAASRLKSEFLANMSHELRTPLNAILGFSELIGQEAVGPLTPKQADFIQEIHLSGRNLMGLINEVLDLAKIEAGKMRLQFQDCAPANAIHEAISMVRVLADNKSVILTCEVDDDQATIQADPARFRQILWNLLSNAIKFTPSGGRVVVTMTTTADEVQIAVVDTGIGIPRQELGKLFTEFYQVDGSHSRRHGGTGLGLALVKRFVGLHHGQIAVESTLGSGSRFTVTLPRVHPDPTSLDRSSAFINAVTAEREDPRRRVLTGVAGASGVER